MEEIPSPCVRNCCLDHLDICMGCFRHIDEIIKWSATSEQQKQTILNKAQQRKQKHIQNLVPRDDF